MMIHMILVIHGVQAIFVGTKVVKNIQIIACSSLDHPLNAWDVCTDIIQGMEFVLRFLMSAQATINKQVNVLIATQVSIWIWKENVSPKILYALKQMKLENVKSAIKTMC